MQSTKVIVLLIVLAAGIITSPNFAFAQTAQDDEYFIDEDTILTVGPIGILDNDTIPLDVTVTAVIKTDVGIGVLVLNSDGSFEYTPLSNFAGSTSFTYAIDNDGVESNEATVTINVNPVNDAPLTVDDTFSTPEDTVLMIIGIGVLDNDEDEENNSLTAVLDTTTTDGSLVLNSDGSFEYTPNPNFVGSDSFTYHANDGADNSNIATVTIEVNPQDSDSVIDSILEQIQKLFDKIFAVEDEVEKLKEQNASLESRIAALEARGSSGDSDGDEHGDSKKALKNEIKDLKKEFKEKAKALKNEYKEKERDLKDQIKDLKKNKKQDKDDDDNDEDDDD